ncbi:glycosyl transferase group 1 [Candidatus Vecturithrix granuli]|uniref:Glycosyl transferase group 1 n=1 Tax=Vecturithrix granuli TaxID=1499967 RepID=A0A0S6W611_VECG1|nr:glycosyl transferase group 1 [Candidatus Vecturithrix granuli]
MKLAFFSPLPPQRSGISDYSEDLLPFLAQGAMLELFTDEGVSPTNSKIVDNFPVYPYTQFGRRHQAAPYDLCLYQMGNNPKYHHYMDALIQTYPGIVTLHDYALQHLYIFLCTKQKRFDEYQEMMETYYGPEGRVIANNFRKGILHDYVFYQYPLFQRVVVPSRGTIVHSQYVKQKILRYDASLHVEMIPMGIMPPDLSQYDVNTLRKQYQIPYDRFVVGAYGYIQPGKRIPELLRSFAELVKETPEALCLLVGHLASPQEVSNFDIRKLIRDLGIEKHVLITGFTPYNQFLDYLALSDVCVNLRHPTVRATSANILKIMAFGKPAIISDLGENLDFPSTVCIKIPLNDTEEEKIFQAIVALSRDPEQRQTMGAQARKFIIEQHSIQQAADKYLAFCQKILNR